MVSQKEQATYSHGHNKAVTNDHARRSAADSAGFLIPHLRPDSTILDVGCGPGSITADLAALVPQGRVIAVDSVASVLEQARELAAARGLTNVEFREVDANALPFADGSFDVVYAHQVLQHVGSPVTVLSEMRRVARPDGGLVAARDADYSSFAWWPEPPMLDRWREVYLAAARTNGGEPNAGRRLHVWAREAGFVPIEEAGEGQDSVETTWDVWRYSGERARQFSESFSKRVLQPGFLGTATRAGIATEDEVRQISQTWAEWGTQKDAFVSIPNAQILGRRNQGGA